MAFPRAVKSGTVVTKGSGSEKPEPEAITGNSIKELQPHQIRLDPVHSVSDRSELHYLYS